MKAMRINLSNGDSYKGTLVVRRSMSDNDMWRAFWERAVPGEWELGGVPVEGYATGKAYKTQRDAAIRAERLHPGYKARRITRTGRVGGYILH